MNHIITLSEAQSFKIPLNIKKFKNLENEIKCLSFSHKNQLKDNKIHEDKKKI